MSFEDFTKINNLYNYTTNFTNTEFNIKLPVNSGPYLFYKELIKLKISYDIEYLISLSNYLSYKNIKGSLNLNGKDLKIDKYEFSDYYIDYEHISKLKDIKTGSFVTCCDANFRYKVIIDDKYAIIYKKIKNLGDIKHTFSRTGLFHVLECYRISRGDIKEIFIGVNYLIKGVVGWWWDFDYYPGNTILFYMGEKKNKGHKYISVRCEISEFYTDEKIINYYSNILDFIPCPLAESENFIYSFGINCNRFEKAKLPPISKYISYGNRIYNIYTGSYKKGEGYVRTWKIKDKPNDEMEYLIDAVKNNDLGVIMKEKNPYWNDNFIYGFSIIYSTNIWNWLLSNKPIPIKDFHLHLACYFGNYDIAKIIVNTKNIDIHYNDHEYFRLSCEFGYFDILKLLYTNRKIDINPDWLFMNASKSSSQDMLRWIINLGIKNKQILFTLAIKHEEIEKAKLMYEPGKTNIYVNTDYRSQEVVEYLLSLDDSMNPTFKHKNLYMKDFKNVFYHESYKTVIKKYKKIEEYNLDREYYVDLFINPRSVKLIEFLLSTGFEPNEDDWLKCFIGSFRWKYKKELSLWIYKNGNNIGENFEKNIEEILNLDYFTSVYERMFKFISINLKDDINIHMKNDIIFKTACDTKNIYLAKLLSKYYDMYIVTENKKNNTIICEIRE